MYTSRHDKSPQGTWRGTCGHDCGKATAGMYGIRSRMERGTRVQCRIEAKVMSAREDEIREYERIKCMVG